MVSPFEMNVIAASAGATDILATLFVALLAAKLGAELFKRIGQPTIVGEILAGVVIGGSVLGLVEPDPTLETFSELGVVFLLFWVGLETRLSDLRDVGSAALQVGVLGVVFPLVGGVTIALAAGEPSDTSLFLGAALVATSVGITSAVLVQLGVVETRWARAIIGAAVVDDILAMIVVAVAVGLAADGEGHQIAAVVTSAGLAVAFVAFFALGGTRLMRKRPAILRAPRFSESPLLPAVLLCLGVAALAAEVGLAAIIGAFLAGMMVAETSDRHAVTEEIAPLYAFFTPFFFVFVGLQLDLEALTSARALALVAITTVVAVVTKYVGAWIGARSLGREAARLVGVGMVPRGEVGIIVAGIARAEDVIGDELFAVIVAMSVITTLIVPPVLRALVARRPPGRAASDLAV
jgi:Kef-type K+ transport system membrane component KefB